MIRIAIAAMILKTTGAHIEYRVQRRKNESGKDGTTVLRTESFKAARKKYANMRIADTDSIVIRLVATVRQRHGTIEASGPSAADGGLE